MLNRKKIFVIGDLIIDEYITGKAVGLSLESPTIKCEHTCTKKSPGGSGNVVMNLVALECDVGYMTVCSDISVYNALSQKAKVHSILSKKIEQGIWIQKENKHLFRFYLTGGFHFITMIWLFLQMRHLINLVQFLMISNRPIDFIITSYLDLNGKR